MSYRVTNLSYDFNSGNVSASIQKTEGDFLALNLLVERKMPVDVPFGDVRSYMKDVIRDELTKLLGKDTWEKL